MSESQAKAFKEVLPRVNVDELERGVLAYWDEERIFEKSLEETKDGKLFTFYDGPPYATGKPHYGHILQSAIKDTVLRYKTMQGYHVPRRVGWDCHGLPVENLVEKELGIKLKNEIEDDIEGFNQKCREVVFTYIDDFTSTLKRMGRWADYSNAYATLDRNYMESEWWVFKQLWDDELIYKDFRSTPYCIRCATALSNFEVSMAYKDVKDVAVHALLRVRPEQSRRVMESGSSTGSEPNQQVYLLIWTTTPWTLPGNMAVAINPELEYVSVEHEGKELIVAKERVEGLFGKEATIVKTWKKDELLGLEYEPLYVSPAVAEKAYRVIAGEHVTADDGTGLVHIAPAFGEEDFQVGKKEGLPVLRTVDLDGKFTAEVEKWAGKKIFDANPEIVADLQERGLLFKEEKYKHSYPFCWRCDTPLIYYALDSWFVKVSQIKETMLATNEQIAWIPDHVKHGRFGKGIESAPDWAISRNRFWSVPMPVWVCDACDHQQAVGSVEELKQLSGASEEAVKDIHRPYVDDITWKCEKCSGTMKRIAEVLDVWFDSGSMPYSQWHYPFENKEFVEKGFPADFIAESIEMTRAWFYVLHVLATALTTGGKALGKTEVSPAYKNVIASGLIFAEDGQKLSKKLKNYPDIEPTLEKYGADVLRFYLLSSTSLGEAYRFSERDLQQLQRNFYSTLWNVYSFFTRYAGVHSWKSETGNWSAEGGSALGGKSEHILDRWIINRFTQLQREVIERADHYHIDTAARLFVAFIDDLSNEYVKGSRDRFQKPKSDTERDEAFGTLHYVLVELAKLLAPFTPFLAEEVYRNLDGSKASVHLERIPQFFDGEEKVTDYPAIDEELVKAMEKKQRIVSEVLRLRAVNKIKLRQPLAELVIDSAVQKDLEKFPEIVELLVAAVNVKEVKFGDASVRDGYVVSAEDFPMSLMLNVTLTDELKAEGVARDVIRQGQVLRREAEYALDDRIVLIVKTDSEDLKKLFVQTQEMITTALQADEIVEEGQEDAGVDVKLMGATVHIGVKRQQ